MTLSTSSQDSTRRSSKWPKVFPPLTAEQQRVSNDFMQYWHHQISGKYQIVDRFNHGYVVKTRPTTFTSTLEIGAGNGEHLSQEPLTTLQKQAYVALELREDMAQELSERHPDTVAVVADCQEPLPYPDNYFDRVLAIHVLEHLPNLPAAAEEMFRVCNKEHGMLSVVIPCEGGLAYSLARKISAERLFRRRYHMPYRWFIEREHVSFPQEIIDELSTFFDITDREFFPIPFLPFRFCNLVIGLTLTPRREALVS